MVIVTVRNLRKFLVAGTVERQFDLALTQELADGRRSRQAPRLLPSIDHEIDGDRGLLLRRCARGQCYDQEIKC
jgi:hypothetical protein